MSWYAIHSGGRVGVYTSWYDCKIALQQQPDTPAAEVSLPSPRPLFGKFESKEDAETFVQTGTRANSGYSGLQNETVHLQLHVWLAEPPPPPQSAPTSASSSSIVPAAPPQGAPAHHVHPVDDADIDAEKKDDAAAEEKLFAWCVSVHDVHHHQSDEVTSSQHGDLRVDDEDDAMVEAAHEKSNDHHASTTTSTTSTAARGAAPPSRGRPPAAGAVILQQGTVSTPWRARAMLTAAVRVSAWATLNKKTKITMWHDCPYLHACISKKWMQHWARRRWKAGASVVARYPRTTAQQPHTQRRGGASAPAYIAHRDLVQKLHQISQRLTLLSFCTFASSNKHTPDLA